jgi:hypothetical protein
LKEKRHSNKGPRKAFSKYLVNNLISMQSPDFNNTQSGNVITRPD